MKEFRFAKEKTCLHCSTETVSRNGKYKGKRVKKRGISNEQICIATAVDRQGNLIIRDIIIAVIVQNYHVINYKTHITIVSMVIQEKSNGFS